MLCFIVAVVRQRQVLESSKKFYRYNILRIHHKHISWAFEVIKVVRKELRTRANVEKSR